jgi:hypothetical protein
MAIEDRFVGSWELLDWAVQAGDGPKIHPYGKDATGLILYTEARRVSATLQQQRSSRRYSPRQPASMASPRSRFRSWHATSMPRRAT